MTVECVNHHQVKIYGALGTASAGARHSPAVYEGGDDESDCGQAEGAAGEGGRDPRKGGHRVGGQGKC